MTHFLVVFLIAMLFSLPSESKRLVSFRFYKWNTVAVPKSQLISFVIVFLFMALRYEFGNDYINYRFIHSDMHHGYISAWHQRNFLFVITNLIISNFYWLIAIISFCYLIAFHLLIRQNLKSNQYWFALLLLLINPSLFLIHLSAIRQALAIAIFILAVHLRQKKFRLFRIGEEINYKRNIGKLSLIADSETFRIQNQSTKITFVYSNIINFIIYTLLIINAAGMHTSALLLLPAYFFLNQKKVTKNFKISLCFFIIVMIFTPVYQIVIDFGLRFFPEYSYHFLPGEGLNFGIGALVNTLFFFLLIFLNIDKLEGKELVYGKLYLIAITFTFIARVSPMITRIGMYFDVFIIVTIPIIFSKIKKGHLKNILFAFMLIIYIARLRSFFNDPIWWSFLEYRTIFNAVQ